MLPLLLAAEAADASGAAGAGVGAAAADAAATAIPPLPPGADPLWLRYPLVLDRNLLHTYRTLITSASVSAGKGKSDAATLAQLRAAAAELGLGLSGLLGAEITATCCTSSAGSAPTSGELVASIVPDSDGSLGAEGFRIGAQKGGVTVQAATGSGLLHGSFRLLSYMQRGETIPRSFTSAPAMALRIWDLWDVLSGEVTRGYAGRSLIWPMALYRDDAPPPRNQVYLAPCNASDPYQRWEGSALGHGAASTIRNLGSGECLNATITRPDGSSTGQNPMMVSPCDAKSTRWRHNANGTISPTVVPQGTNHGCINVQNGEGPDIDIWCAARDFAHQRFDLTERRSFRQAHQSLCVDRDCHPAGSLNAQDDQFVYSAPSQQIRPAPGVAEGQCFTLLQAWPADPLLPTLDPWEGRYKARFEHMMRLLKSAGLNGKMVTLSRFACCPSR